MNIRVLGNDEAPQAYVWHFLFKVPDVYACEAPRILTHWLAPCPQFTERRLTNGQDSVQAYG